MKKAIISIWAILLMVSCQKNELVPEYVYRYMTEHKIDLRLREQWSDPQ